MNAGDMEKVLVLLNINQHKIMLLQHLPSKNSQKLTCMGGGIPLAALNRIIDKIMEVLPWSLWNIPDLSGIKMGINAFDVWLSLGGGGDRE